MHRILEIALGTIFLVGAASKLHDINLFAVQISAYGVLESSRSIDAAALGTVGAEVFLGLALVLGWRLRGATYSVVEALLVGFTGLIVYGWIFHNLADCGCFGPLKMSPGKSIAKNVVMLGLLWLAWYYHRKAAKEVGAPESARDQEGLSPLAKGAICVAWCVLAVVYGSKHLERPVSAGTFSQVLVDQEQARVDLTKGEHLVALLSAQCEHCRAAVKDLNGLHESAGSAPIVGLCLATKDELDEFRALTKPEFPTHRIGIRIFNTLLGTGAVPPRFLYVRDGVTLMHWDEKVPSAEAVLEARSKAASALSQ